MDILVAIYASLVFVAIFHLCNLALQWRDQCCYILDYQCYKGTDEMMLNAEASAKITLRNKNLGPPELKFLLKTMANAGIGPETYCPKSVLIDAREQCPLYSDTIAEMEDIFFQTLDKIFARSKIPPSEIDILVVDVSLLSVVPSLPARIINHYKMREDVKVYNLSGMGCSASVVAVSLVQTLFQLYKNKYAIVVSTESASPSWYNGRETSMLLPNILFRVGGASILLTNKRSLKHKAMFKLKCMVRTHLAAREDAFNCVKQQEDELGYRGISLSKNLPNAAAQAITENLKVLMPQILPIKEMLRYIVSRKLYPGEKTRLNYKAAVEHFCIHPGGRAVVDGVGKSLGLDDYDVEPTRMTLHRWGNTSAGGLWYVLNYMEARKRLKIGDRVLMLSLGAGLKCNNCVWEVMRDLKDECQVWQDCIDQYPQKALFNPYMERYNKIFGGKE